MLQNMFEKITPINGFDTNDNNAMQNNYAWSMSELGEYLYVGTGRNILLSVLQAIQQSGRIPGFQIPESLIPDPIDNRGEIWRYHKGLPCAGWNRVFKAPQGVLGFRYMIRYTDPHGCTALYAGTLSSPKVRVYRSLDGLCWREMDNSNLFGTSTRSMIIHTNGKLYMSTVEELAQNQQAYIYEYIPPMDCCCEGSWRRVTEDSNTPGFDENRNPVGQVAIMESFNGHIYAGVSNNGGFQLWRTTGTEPRLNGWKLVIDKGAGDALNKIPLTLGIFKDYLYVGAIMFPLLAENPASLSAFKPFDLIRIDKNDNWQLVIGGKPVEPTNPTTGTRGKPLSGLPSGAGNPFNLYCWQLQEYRGEFYLGTFDWLIVLVTLLPSLIENIDLEAILGTEQFNSVMALAKNPLGSIGAAGFANMTGWWGAADEFGVLNAADKGGATDAAGMANTPGIENAAGTALKGLAGAGLTGLSALAAGFSGGLNGLLGVLGGQKENAANSSGMLGGANSNRNPLINPITRLFLGFDLYKSCDGIHWVPITINGLGNPYNYGDRILFKSTNGHLYLGTANPFQGCEVWQNKMDCECRG